MKRKKSRPKVMRTQRKKRTVKLNTDAEPARRGEQKLEKDAVVSRERREIPIGPGPSRKRPHPLDDLPHRGPPRLL